MKEVDQDLVERLSEIIPEVKPNHMTVWEWVRYIKEEGIIFVSEHFSKNIDPNVINEIRSLV